MSTVNDPAAGGDVNSPILATLEKSVKDLGEQVNTKLDTFASKKDIEILDTTLKGVKDSVGAMEIKIKDRDLQSKYHGLPFRDHADFFQTLTKASLRGPDKEPDAYKAIYGDGGYIKRMDVIAREVYKAPTGFNTQSNEGEIFILPEWSDEIMRTPSSRSEIAARCRSFPMTGNLYRIRALVDKTHTTSVSGGFTVSRIAESVSPTSSVATWEFIEFRPNKLGGLFYLTEEMMEDSGAFASLLPPLILEQFESQKEEDVLFGNGVGEPLGMLSTNNPALLTVARAGATAIATADVLKMRQRVYSRNWGNYVWVTSPDVIPQLGILSNANNNLYLTSIKSGADFDTLLGRPVLYSDHVVTLGTRGDLNLVDPTQYAIANKGGVTQQQSVHVRFLQGETAFRFTVRNDGKPLWRAALQPRATGQTTKSPFIQLTDAS